VVKLKHVFDPEISPGLGSELWKPSACVPSSVIEASVRQRTFFTAVELWVRPASGSFASRRMKSEQTTFFNRDSGPKIIVLRESVGANWSLWVVLAFGQPPTNDRVPSFKVVI
jgi:hypothetical protein